MKEEEVYSVLEMLVHTRKTIDKLYEKIDEILAADARLRTLIAELEGLTDWDVNGEKCEYRDEYEYLIREIGFFEPHDDAEDEKPCFVYYIFNEEKDKVKIGISNNPLQRAKDLQTACGEEISIMHTIEFPNREKAFEAEQFLHREFSQFRKHPSKVAKSCEWFDAGIVPDLMRYYDTEERIEHLKKRKRRHLQDIMPEVAIK